MSIKLESIKSDLANYQEIVKRYSKAEWGKAVFEIIKTHLPFLAIFVGAAIAYEYSILLSILFSVAGGLFLTRMFIIQHDCGHQAFTPSKKGNNAIGFITSFFTLIPYKYWAKSHNYHHAHQGQIDTHTVGDVTLLTVEEYTKLSKWEQFKYRVYRNPVSLFFIGPMYYIFIHNRIPFVEMQGWEKAKRSLMLTNVYLLAFYAALGFLIGFQKMLIIYVPIIFVFATISIWFFYIQHQHNPNYKAYKKDWDFISAAIVGSSYYKLPAFMNFFTGNIGYHHIHHLASKIPFYKLPKCSVENPILQKHVPTLKFFGSLKYAFYTLWNEKNQQMITFRQYRKMFVIQKVKA